MFSEFQEKLKKRESSNNYKAVNKFGYLGAYQFGKMRLYDLGYSLDNYSPFGKRKKTYLSKDDFLNNKDLQDRLFKQSMREYYKLIKRKYEKNLNRPFQHNGKIFTLTISGAMAVCHLLGVGGLVSLLKGYNKTDGNGTQASEYAYLFSGFDVEDLINE